LILVAGIPALFVNREIRATQNRSSLEVAVPKEVSVSEVR